MSSKFTLLSPSFFVFLIDVSFISSTSHFLIYICVIFTITYYDLTWAKLIGISFLFLQLYPYFSTTTTLKAIDRRSWKEEHKSKLGKGQEQGVCESGGRTQKGGHLSAWKEGRKERHRGTRSGVGRSEEGQSGVG